MPAASPRSPRASGRGIPAGRTRGQAVHDACEFCLQARNLNRTIRIALVVGVVLTLINQGSVIGSGHATLATWIRCGLNFVVPFLVSNAGLLSARR